VQKCGSCGFPISEGRALCLDCEKKDSEKKDFEKKQRERAQSQIKQDQIEQQEIKQPEQDTSSTCAADSAAPVPGESAPAFLTNYAPARESWMANHVNLLAIVVLILGILVAIVLFR